jgi:general stress protein 26
MFRHDRSSLGISCCLSALALAAILGAPAAGGAQEKPKAPPDPAAVLAAAREIMVAQKYCALITLDPSGSPQIRTMNPFAPDEAMVVWLATNTRTRKVDQIRKNPRVSLYYADHATGTGYVQVSGTAVLVDDMKEVIKRKRAYWDEAFPGLENITLIKVVPERIDVINYKQGMTGDPATWRSPSVAVASK